MVKSVAIAIALSVLTGLGFLKLYIEPRVEVKDNRKKYATALYIACKELNSHLTDISTELKSERNVSQSAILSAMIKISDNDSHERPDWFTKQVITPQ